MEDPDVSIIVPAINEADNLAPLANRIAEALGGRSFEIIIVDDNSRDQTPQICAELARTLPVKLMVRTDFHGGLSGAVLHGMAAARGKYFVVMDADLQHPPEKIPELLAVLDSGQGDFALGSRYVAGGSTHDRWSLFRKMNSRVSTLLAHPFAGDVKDPMSGFFALSRKTYDAAQRLTPLGYKIALELMCKCRVRKVVEVPIHFGQRTRGQSKLSLKQQFKYLEHLSRLYDFTFPRLAPVFKFGVVTLLSWFIGFAVYLILLRSEFDPISAPLLAYAGGLLMTAIFHARYIRTQREFILRPRPWIDFGLIAVVEMAVVAVIARWLVIHARGLGSFQMFLIPFAAATITRYVLRKELLLDIRGLRRDLRSEDLA